MDRNKLVSPASDSSMGERQAEAFWRRHLARQSRGEAADAMETSASNVDNLERAACEKLRHAENLVNVIRGAGYDDLLSVGLCADCDEPTDSLQPGQDDVPMDEWVMVCQSCHADY
ncbi:hypothetical protein PM033_17140 [Halorubrum ezzemoulense]|uniref:hypothetical protein n=1 Tax=Halorubrum ezzemoulense TaxID=337243 RepID=UPI00232E2AD6|nr:hypothetical protein [Halorubrum ezzemoulense]MDB2253450.1 hypothetical protein [Halorubrum ezzemoulense]